MDSGFYALFYTVVQRICLMNNDASVIIVTFLMLKSSAVSRQLVSAAI